MSTPARIVLLVGTAWVLGLALDSWREARVRARMVPPTIESDGVLEGRVALDEALVALLGQRGAPELVARVDLPSGRAVVGVEDNGRFRLTGLPLAALDVELRLGGELLARVPGIVPSSAGEAAHGDVAPDPRLDGVALAGPLRWIELGVQGVDGAALDRGWLAWRASGEATFERTVPVRDGRAAIVTTAELVDVVPLVPGSAAEEFACALGGEVLTLSPVGPVVAYAPSTPAGIELRLELVQSTPPAGLLDEALLRASEAHGGWAEPDGRAELLVVGAGPVVVQWGAYRRAESRLTRARGVRSIATHVPALGLGERVVSVPLDLTGLARRDRRELSR